MNKIMLIGHARNMHVDYVHVQQLRTYMYVKVSHCLRIQLD